MSVCVSLRAFGGLHAPSFLVRVLFCALFLMSASLLFSANAGDADGDGDVDVNDINLISAARGTPASGPGDPRDIDKDGSITALDVRRATVLCSRPNCSAESTTISVDSAPTSLDLVVGQGSNISTSVVFTTALSSTFAVSKVQTISPSSGISVTPAVTPGFSSATNFSTVDNQLVVANAPGTYQIVTTATIAQTGQTSSKTVTVRVTAVPTPSIVLRAPGSEPAAVVPGGSTPVKFTVQVQGVAGANAPIVVLTGPGVSVPMNDNGQGADAVAGDSVYSVTAPVNTAGVAAGQCLSFFASAGSIVSPAYPLCATSVPPVVAPSEVSNTFVDAGQKVVPDDLVLVFKAGVTEAQMKQVVAAANGAIVGSIPNLRQYQVRISPRPSSLAALTSVMNTIKSSPAVESVFLNAVGQPNDVVPSDPQYGSQWALAKIRAGEAWTIARGGPVIAILDTGIDYGHPDLSGKVLNGWDFINADADPRDDHGHGTHVAGIAAAAGNNGVGVAGVAWGSPLLPGKVLSAGGSGSGAAVANGIVWAANSGARVINLSLGGTHPALAAAVCPAVAYATSKGSLVVASAGNNGNNVPSYPAACLGAMAVGNTTQTDGRAASSTFGDWVAIAAPGSSILSTMPTYYVTLNSYGYPLNYASLTGTSMAAPLVAGAAAVVLSRDSALSQTQLVNRLRRSASPLPAGLQLGSGRLDLMEAVFDGGFEDPDMPFWSRIGTASSVVALGPIKPISGARMGLVSTGPAGDQVSGTLTQSFVVQPGIKSLSIRFTYAFVTEEFPEWVGSIYNDSLRITLQTPTGQLITLAAESINGSAFVPIGGIDFPGGDQTVGWTGWKTASFDIPITSGPGQYRIFLTDAGDNIYDTVTLIDKIEFR